MERRRIFGTNYYATFEGNIENEDGLPVKTYLAKGYLYFYKGKKRIFVHRAVAEAFIKYSKKSVRHLDGDKTNNAAWNLEYDAMDVNLRAIHTWIFKK